MKFTTNKGETFHLDAVDADLAAVPWYVDVNGYIARSKHVRIARNKYTSRKIYLHHLVLQRVIGEVKWSIDTMVDHRDRDRLNNRRTNLRLASRASNGSNVAVRSHSRTGIKGVHWDASRQKYQAYITVDSKRLVIGRFKDAAEAAWMRDQWALELHCEFASLNFDYI